MRSLILILTLLQTQAVFGRDFYVRRSGRDRSAGTSAAQAFRSIQRAVDVARAGDVIYVGGGTHYGFNIYRKRYSGAPLRIVGDLDGTKTGDKGRPEIHGSYNHRSRGAIHVDRSHNVQFTGLKINRGREDGFRLTDATNIVITDCQIHGMNDEGMMIDDSTVTISKCTITDCDSDGIYMDNSSGTVEDCVIRGNRGSGFDVRNSSRATLRVNRCIISHNTHRGIYLRYSGQKTFSNCLINHNYQEGVKSYSPTNLYHCTIIYNRNDGVEAERGSNVKVYNCVVSYNQQSALQRDGGELLARYCNFYKNSHGVNNGRVRQHSNYREDPKLDRYYRPSASSPLIDKATSSLASTDLDGVTRPQGPRPDIGAYEFKKRDRPTVYYLRVSGGDDNNSGESPDQAWKTVRRAFRNIQAGDTLYVGGGTYNVRWVGRYLKSGQPGRPIKIIGDPSGARTGQSGQALIRGHYHGVQVGSRKSDIHFENLTFEGRQGGLSFAYCNRITVNRCQLSGRYYSCSMVGSNVVMKHCTFRGGERAGVQGNSSTLTLEDSRIYGRSRGYGIWVTKTRYTPSVLKVSRCKIADKRYGVYTERAGVTVSDSLFTNNSTHLLMYDVAGTARIKHCTIVGGSYGVRLDGHANLSLQNSIIYKTYTGIWRKHRHRATLSHNLFYGLNRNHSVVQWWGRTVNGPADGYKVADPLFVDPGNNFRLQPTSPAIDNGMDTDSAHDLASNQRPKFDGFDIGCYEAQTVGQDDPDPGTSAPVVPLWGVTSDDAMVFRIRNYNRPVSTLQRFGRLQSKPGVYLDDDISAMTIDSSARMYVAYRSEAGGAQVTRLGRLTLNHLTDPDRIRQSAVQANNDKMVLQQIGVINHREPVKGMAIDPSSNKLYVITQDRVLMTVDMKNGRIGWQKTVHFPRHPNPRIRVDYLPPRPTDLTFDQDGRLFASDLDYFVLELDKTSALVKARSKKLPQGTWESLAFDHIAGRLIAGNVRDRKMYHVRQNKGIYRDLGNTGLKIQSLTAIPGDGATSGKLRIVEWREIKSRK